MLGGLKTITATNVTVVGANVTAPGAGVGGAAGAAARGGGLLGGIKTGAALASPVLAGLAAVEVVNFMDMREEAMGGLQSTLDAMPRRTGAEVDLSISKIEAQLQQERPFLEGILFNTNVRPQLEQEIAELQENRVAIARTEAAMRDAIPWHQRNVEEIHNLNMSEAQRGAAKDANDAARASAQLQKQSEALAAVRATQGPLNTIAAKNFSPIVNVNTHVNSFVSINEWQRTVQSAQTSYSTNSGGI